VFHRKSVLCPLQQQQQQNNVRDEIHGRINCGISKIIQPIVKYGSKVRTWGIEEQRETEALCSWMYMFR